MSSLKDIEKLVNRFHIKPSLIKQNQTLAEALKTQEKLYAQKETEVSANIKSRQGLGPFIILGLILLVYKVIEVLPSFTPSLIIKLTPVILVFVFFGLLKENPFKVNQNLKLKGNIG